MRQRIVTAVLIIFCSVALAAQVPTDSLIVILDNESDDRVKLQLLEDLAFTSISQNPDDVKDYASQYLNICETNGYNGDMAQGYNLLGIAYHIKGKTHKALDQYRTALKWAESHGPEALVVKIHNNFGLVYREHGEHQKAYEQYQNGLKLSINENDTLSQALFWGNIIFEQAKLNQCVESENSSKILLQLMNTGYNFRRRRDILEMNILISKAICYQNAGEHQKAILQLDKVFPIAKRCNDVRTKAKTHLQKGDCLRHLKKWNSAEYEYNAALSVINTLPYHTERVKAYLSIAKIHKQTKRYQSALSHANKAYDKALSTSLLKGQADALALKVNIYNQQGDNRLLYNANQELIAVKDSLAVLRRASILKELDYSERAQRIANRNIILQSEKAKAESQLKFRSYSILTAISLLGLLAMIMRFLYRSVSDRKKRSQLLQDMVDERTNELIALNKKLSATNKELANFAYITSHDLKEPLRNIGGFISLYETENKEQLHPSSIEYIESIRSNVRQMQMLINDVLAYSQVHDGKIPVESFDLNEVVNEKKNKLAQLVFEKNGRITHSNLPTITSNRTQVNILFKNMIENGLKYNDSEYPEVHITHEQSDTKHMIYFKDNGIGIDPKYQEDIFGLFNRLHSKDLYIGSGLGLTICKQIIQRLGGDIKLKSEIGKGSTFIVELPVAPHHDGTNMVEQNEILHA